MPKSANKTAATPTTEAPAWALIWPNLKIFILSRFAWERMKTDEQEKIRAEYGEGLAILDWVAAQKFDPQKLLVIERRTWKQIPEDIREKLRNEYGEGDGLRVLADDFLVMKDSKNYPTSQRGNALLFCALFFFSPLIISGPYSAGLSPRPGGATISRIAGPVTIEL